MTRKQTPEGRRMQDALATRVRGLARPRRAARKAAPVPDEVQAAVRRALEQGDTHYTSRPGIPELRTVVVDRLAAAGLPVSRADTDVVITAGGEEALFVIAMALRARKIAANLEGLDAAARELLRLTDVSTVDAGDPYVSAEAGDVQEAARLIDFGSRLFTAREPRIHTAPPGVWAAFGDLDGVPGLASFRVGFAAGEQRVMAGARTWKQAFSICTAAPSQQAALAALARIGGAR